MCQSNDLDFCYWCNLDVDIPSQVEGSLLLPPTFGTVVARSQLAIVSLVGVFVKGAISEDF